MEALSLPPEAQETLGGKIAAALAPFRSAFGYVGQGASVSSARHIHAAYIGPGSRIAGASLIRNAALLSAPDAPCLAAEDAWIENSLLQPGTRVESGGKVSGSLLLTRASVAWGGMVIQSVVGSDTQVHKGEMTASVAGPFVGFHHQSLLISALWPEGRGNIAYGANIGSNHTGRKPDQEIRPGEGAFFGLGCTIKFPADFRDAPYSLIASGVTTLPQRLAFPFALISQPLSAQPGLSPALNEISPGWMWSDNAYSLVRRAYKFESAEKTRQGFFASCLFTPELAGQVLSALLALRAAPPDRPYYLEEHIPGLGKNVLRAETRVRALAAYEDYLGCFLLRTYAHAPRAAWHSGIQSIITEITKAISPEPVAKPMLTAQRPRLAAFRRAIRASLLRDDTRGRQIQDDYAGFHPAPESDAVLTCLDQDLADLNQSLDAFLKAP